MSLSVNNCHLFVRYTIGEVGGQRDIKSKSIRDTINRQESLSLSSDDFIILSEEDLNLSKFSNYSSV